MSDINATRLPFYFQPGFPWSVGDDVNPTLTRGESLC
uniref:Cyclopeptide FYFQPGFP n=1 Tax=Amanita virosa TaxID=78357 RepID=A0A6G9EN34_AMAVR|nr:cyclopeptide FYFQPGFP [Amanita virosa]